MTKNNDTALLPIPKNREIWTFSEAEKLCAWYSENFETISLVLHNTRPTAPQNAEAFEEFLSWLRMSPFIKGYLTVEEGNNGLIEKIRAALNQPRTVKPLVWVEMGQDEYMANTPLARYHVFRKFGSWFWSFNDGPDNICSSEDEAKAAAEAHWQQKIGECLV